MLNRNRYDPADYMSPSSYSWSLWFLKRPNRVSMQYEAMNAIAAKVYTRPLPKSTWFSLFIFIIFLSYFHVSFPTRLRCCLRFFFEFLSPFIFGFNCRHRNNIFKSTWLWSNANSTELKLNAFFTFVFDLFVINWCYYGFQLCTIYKTQTHTHKNWFARFQENFRILNAHIY